MAYEEIITSTMGAATSSAAGTKGLVPAPAAGSQGKFLRGDGTWASPGSSGHDMLSTVAGVEAITSTSDAHVVSAYVIKNYSNRYTNSVISTLTAGNNSITITNNVFKNDDATYEFMYEPVSGSDPLVIASYSLDTSTGTMVITVSNAPTSNTRVRVDVTTYRA